MPQPVSEANQDNTHALLFPYFTFKFPPLNYIYWNVYAMPESENLFSHKFVNIFSGHTR
jgi:hypothetical protein